MADVKFTDYSIQVKEALGDALTAFLYEAAGEIEAQTKRNTPVDTGDLKKLWEHIVDGDTATIGSPLENAIWNEFGTGEYALEGKGRKSAWYIPVDGYTGKRKPTFQGKVVIVYGKNKKAFYKTDGKKPQRSLHKAFVKCKPAVIRRAEEIVGERMK